MKITKKGRMLHFPMALFSMRFVARCASAALLPALLQVPAFFSCTQMDRPVSTRHIQVRWQAPSASDSIVVLFFDTLGVCRLDSWQQLPAGESGSIRYGLSGPGVKQLVAISSARDSAPAWEEVSTLGQLRKWPFSLRHEKPEKPLLYGSCLLEDGASRSIDLPLKPLLAGVSVRSILCDFSGRPYQRASFSCSSLFLSYAPAEALPLDSGRVVSRVSTGDIDSAAVLALPRPEMLLQKGWGHTPWQRIYPGSTLYCYPSQGDRGPLPRLVLAGTVEGQPCYYAIELPGLESGYVLQLDLTLLRMGTPSPDIVARTELVRVESQSLPWRDYEPYIVSF